MPFEVSKVLRTDHFRVTQNFNHHIGFFVQSSALYTSSQKKVPYCDASKMTSIAYQDRGHANFLPMSQSQLFSRNWLILKNSKRATNGPQMMELTSTFVKIERKMSKLQATNRSDTVTQNFWK